MTLKKAALLLTSTVLLTRSVSAQVVYDNFGTDLGYYLDEKTLENGDQITLSTGVPTTISNFTFEYWIEPAFYVGNETVRIRFYTLDGPPISTLDLTPTPGTVLYDSGTISLTGGSGRVRDTLSALNVTVPSTFVWSAQFSGGNTAQIPVGSAGVTLYSPPTVGGNEYEFWQNNGTSWNLYYFDGFPTDFGAQITVVPEPAATAAVLLLTATGVVAWRRMRVLSTSASTFRS